MAVSKFQGGSPFKVGSVYTCVSCSKRTRETGHGESSVNICRACWVIGGEENVHSDQGHPGRFADCSTCRAALEGTGVAMPAADSWSDNPGPAVPVPGFGGGAE